MTIKKEASLEEDINKLLESRPIKEKEKINKMIQTLVRIGRESKDPDDLRIMHNTLSELRKSFKLFQRYRDSRKICLFGSARTRQSDPNFQLAEQFSKRITEKGFMLITGAGPGIMEAGNKGALPNTSFGVNIILPFEQEANPYIANEAKLTSFKYFFNRKLTFIKESDGTVLFPGGYGTLDEAYEVLTLVQTGRTAPRPLVLLSHDKDPYWEKWIDFVQNQLLVDGHISPEDYHLFRQFHDVEKASEYIENYYKIYHSVRYAEEASVIRLNQDLTKDRLKDINIAFKDLLLKGEFEQYRSEDIKFDHEYFPNKTKLVFHFNRYNFGRLNEMIHFINEIHPKK